MSYPIIDVEFIDLIEPLTPGWDVWSCEAVLDDGSTITGTIIGDGISAFDAESFVEEDEE